jgi:hypothetical protein
MCISRWIPRTKNTHSEYVTLIAFLLQQQLRECASMLRYAHIACFVYSEQLQSKAMNICSSRVRIYVQTVTAPKRDVKAILTGS